MGKDTNETNFTHYELRRTLQASRNQTLSIGEADMGVVCERPYTLAKTMGYNGMRVVNDEAFAIAYGL